MGATFFVIALALLSITIYSVYNFLLILLTSIKFKKILVLYGLIISCFGFIVLLVLSRTFTNLIVHWLYVVFSLILGFLFYLTIFAICLQLIRLFKFKINQLLFVRVSFLLAIILFTIGLYNAAFPRIKNISVKMAGLQTTWQGRRIVQISDVHLGGVYGLGFLSRQVTRINALDPDLVVITGDLFDGTENRLNSFGPELAKLKAKKGVIFIPGNHDNYLGLNKIEPVLKEANIIFLKDEALVIDGLEVIGLDVHELNNEDTNLVVTNLQPYSGQARLLLKHIPKDIAWAKYLSVGLQLSGHSHNGQMFPLSLLTYLFYGQYQYGLHTEGDFNIYTSSGLGSWGPPVRTFNPAEIVVITIN